MDTARGLKGLDVEFQLGLSLACQPKAPTSECLLPSVLECLIFSAESSSIICLNLVKKFNQQELIDFRISEKLSFQILP